MMFVVCCIGWMTHYEGITEEDKISLGGSYSDDKKHEVFNFSKNGGFCYGYVQGGNKQCFNLSKIAKKDVNSDSLENVLVIWVAPRKTGGLYIVGWYKNATVYRDYKKEKGREYNFCTKAKYRDCILLPDDERTFEVFRSKSGQRGFLGRPRVWYGDYDSLEVKKHVADILSYINNYQSNKQKKVASKTFKVNVERNKKIENAAVKFVKNHYKRLGYNVISVEKENKGWDLEATKGRNTILIEVKGLSGSEISVRISRNEYEKMTANNNSNYRLCVVTQALKTPHLSIFLFNGEKWIDESDSSLVLSIDEQIAAIAYVK